MVIDHTADGSSQLDFRERSGRPKATFMMTSVLKLLDRNEGKTWT